MIDRIVVWALTARARFADWAKDQRGQDIMEYALITGGIAIVLIVAITVFTGAITSAFTVLKNCIDFNAATVCGPF